MTPIYDSELEKELQEKKYTYEEVYLMAEHIYKKSKKTKYLTLFLVGLWTPAITFLCWAEIQHPVAFLAGAVVSTFAVYVFDETYEVFYNYIIGKMKKHEQRNKDKRD
jgi:hypothetical protein